MGREVGGGRCLTTHRTHRKHQDCTGLPILMFSAFSECAGAGSNRLKEIVFWVLKLKGLRTPAIKGGGGLAICISWSEWKGVIVDTVGSSRCSMVPCFCCSHLSQIREPPFHLILVYSNTTQFNNQTPPKIKQNNFKLKFTQKHLEKGARRERKFKSCLWSSKMLAFIHNVPPQDFSPSSVPMQCQEGRGVISLSPVSHHGSCFQKNEKTMGKDA